MVQTVEAGAGRTQPVTEGVQAASLVTMYVILYTSVKSYSKR